MSLSGLFILFLSVVSLGSAGAAYFLFVKWKRQEQEGQDLLAHLESLDKTLSGYKRRFAPVIEIDAEISRVQKILAERRQASQEAATNLIATKSELTVLSEELSAVREASNLAEIGIYEPHYPFGSSQEYKQKIQQIRTMQKDLIKSGEAVKANTEWTVAGSKVEGQKMMKKSVQLTTRAFNNECETCIDNVTWSNIDTMTARIKKAHEDINKFNELNNVVISTKFLNLKIEELRLTHEFHLKKQQEKEEQAEIARQIREEDRAKKEADAAAEKAQREEKLYQGLLDKARTEAQAAAQALSQSHAQKDQEKLDRLQQELAALEGKLAEAHAKNERAKSMAQQTKTGHVYIISNVGSFGQNVYKIGMTRRLEPQDRVDELGDASVPFCFDVHAMVHSSNAPELEAQLHRVFANRRVNRVNLKKEFFHVSLDEIQREVQKLAPQAVFITTAAADEFLQSQAIALAAASPSVST